jgi:drug/metabolite transporter (DMT)-like permease
MTYAIGIASALVASLFFNVGIALQGIEARAAPRELGLRLGLLTRLLRRPRWVAGWLLGTLGIAPQVLALADAPFVVVQPALATGLLVLLVLGARIFHEHVGIIDVLGVLAIIGGVALVAVGAPPRVETHRGVAAVVAVVGVLSASSLAPFALRGTRFDTGLLANIASGCGFAASNIATKLLSDDVGHAHYIAAVGWAAVLLVTGVAATLTAMTAFQRLRATTVVPVNTAVQTFLPIVLEPLFLRERWTSAPLGGAPIAIGLVLALVGAILVTRTRAVSDLAAAAQNGGA